MATVMDSYSETNQDSVSSAICSDGIQGFAQCFTGNGDKIVDAKWYLRKHTSPTGNAVAKIYTMTGTFGTNGNVGTLLATSDNVDTSTLGIALTLVTFPFSGANQYATTNGVRYVVSVEYFGGTAATSYIELGYDSTGTHPGTWTFLQLGTWTPTDAGIDLCFYVDGVPVAVDVTVNLTGVGASPAIGTGTVTIASVTVTPPVEELVPSHLQRWLEDEEVLLQGVEANPQIGSGTVRVSPSAREMFERYPFPQLEVKREPRRIPPLVVREPPPPPFAMSVYLAGPQPLTAIGRGRVKIVAELSEYELMLLAAMDN